MARDFRSRNNRTRQVQHHTQTVKQPYQEWGIVGRYTGSLPRERNPNNYPSAQEMRAITGSGNGYMEGPGGRLSLDAKLGPNRYVATGYNFGRDDMWEVGLVDKVKTTTRNYTTTSFNPTDGRDQVDDEDDRASTARRKKQGRSGLTIALQADPSQGRLKNRSGQTRPRAGAQGGGRSGLNIPR